MEVQPFADARRSRPGRLHVAVDAGARAFADGVHRYGGALGFFPADLPGDDPDTVKQGLEDAYRGLLTRDFDQLLFARGDPLVRGGKVALTDFPK